MQRRVLSGLRGRNRGRAAVDEGLRIARVLVGDGRFSEAGTWLDSLEADALERHEFYSLRGQCFLALGHLHEANRNLRWARRLGADEGWIKGSIAAIARHREGWSTAGWATSRVQGRRVKRYLGTGWEGAVYLCETPDGRDLVLKQFHSNRIEVINRVAPWPWPAARTSIVHLSHALQRAPHPLFFRYDCIEREGRLEALHYPHRHLHAIGRTELQAPALRLALLRSALSGQAHLIERAGMVMVDLRTGQFMFDRLARIRYIDYGASILPLDDSRVREQCVHAQSLVLLLVELFAWRELVDFRRLQVISDPPSQLQRRIDQSPGLQRALEELPALRPFIGRGALEDPSRLTDPGTYRAAADAIPFRRPLEVLARSTGWEFRRGIRRLRNRLGV